MSGDEAERLSLPRRGKELGLVSGTKSSEYFLCSKSFAGGWGFILRMLTMREEGCVCALLVL